VATNYLNNEPEKVICILKIKGVQFLIGALRLFQFKKVLRKFKKVQESLRKFENFI
jgi:hypothetical protein